MITITPKVNGMYRSSYSVYLLQYHIVTKYRNPVLQGSVKTSVYKTIEDMLEMFNNFDLVEKMCEILAHDVELKEKYSTQLAYFKKNFYKIFDIIYSVTNSIFI